MPRSRKDRKKGRKIRMKKTSVTSNQGSLSQAQINSIVGQKSSTLENFSNELEETRATVSKIMESKHGKRKIDFE